MKLPATTARITKYGHISFIVVVFCLFYLYGISYPRIVYTTKKSTVGQSLITETQIELPYKSSSAFSRKQAPRNKPKNYEFKLYTLSYPFQNAGWNILTSDCIKEVKVNDTDVPLNTYTRKNLCNPPKGLYLELNKYMRSGHDTISVTVADQNGGNYSFSMRPAFRIFGVDIYNIFKLPHLLFACVSGWVLAQVYCKLRNLE